MIRFGVQMENAQQERLSFEEMKRIVIKLERLGYDSAFIYDHFHSLGKNPRAPCLECWTVLSALAPLTDKLRLGPLVTCSSYRHPSVLAKMAATLDVISGGRLEFMIGAGWFKDEYRAYGIPFPTAARRIEQLREGVQVIKKMWTEEEASFKGAYYTISGAFNNPKPIQKPHPPIWIGGSGEKLTLKVVAEVGDGSNFAGTPEVFKHKVEVLKEHCHRAGRNPSEIQKSWLGQIIIAKREREVKEKIQRLSPTFGGARIVGTPKDCIEKVKEYEEAGATYLTLLFPDLPQLESLKLFAEEVIPMFK